MQVCVHHCPDLLGPILSCPTVLLTQVLLHEDPLGDQDFNPGAFKCADLLEGVFAHGMGVAESGTKSWGTGGCLWT